jgi:c-di-GMP-related signal transduction protein
MKQPVYHHQKEFPGEFISFIENVNDEKNNHQNITWKVESDFILQYIIDAWNNNVTNTSDVIKSINHAINNSAYEEWIRGNCSC